MKVVIVGAGQAGGWVAATLKEGGLDEVELIGEELHPPYERPPLSKEVLLGDKPPESTHLWPRGLGVRQRMGVRVEAIDRTTSRLKLSDGDELAYDKLVLATGGRVRRLAQIPHAHYLRTIDDALSLRQALEAGGSVTIVGGGWIGLEVAAAARKLGRAVTVVELADRLCARVLPPCVSQYLYDLHTRQGVRIQLAANANAGVADTVVVGIGIEPNVELALDAGLAVSNGVVVDEYGRTSDPNVYAVGDVANLRGMRLESWANAQNQAIATAKTILGDDTPYQEIPWFWSDQHGVNIQILGVPKLEDEVVVRGEPTEDKVSYFFLRDGTVAGLVAVNTAREVRVTRKLMEMGKVLTAAQLADTSQALQSLLKP